MLKYIFISIIAFVFLGWLVISQQTKVYIPIDGVVCDKGLERCYNGAGFAPFLTQRFFDLKDNKADNTERRYVKFSNGVICDFESTRCHSDDYDLAKELQSTLFMDRI